MAPEQQGLGFKSDREAQIILTWPPTVNTYWDRMPMVPAGAKIQAVYEESDHDWAEVRRFLMSNTRQIVRLTKRATAFREQTIARVLEARMNIGLMGMLSMEMRAFPPDRRERDLDNIYKPLQDALQHAGVYMSDYQIAEHKRCRRELQVVKGGRVEITLTPLVY